MGRFLDIADIKQRFPIMDVVRLLDIQVAPDGECFRGKCPYCDDKRSFRVTPQPRDKQWGLAGCFACGKKNLSNVQLVMDFKGFDAPNDAGDWIIKQLGSSADNRTVPSTGRSTVPLRKSTVPESESAAQAEGSSARGGGKSSPQAGHTFDPEAFLAKLQYTERVAALGKTEEECKALGIGEWRGKIYHAERYDTGQIAGFAEGEFNLPKRLIQKNNVVQLRPKSA